MNWRQINRDLNDYHSDPIEISSTYWLPDISDWWREQEETHAKYADLSNVACDIFSIIPHGVGVEAKLSLGRDVIGWRQSETTVRTRREKVVVWLFARANNWILADTDPKLDAKNPDDDSEMKKEAEETKLHRMAKVHNFLVMWWGSQNLCATQEESCPRNIHITAVGYISDTEEIVRALWSLFHHDGAAAFLLSGWSPLPPPVSAKDFLGGQTRILIGRRIWRINRHPVESDEDSAPESISDSDDWQDWNGDIDNPNDSGDDCAAVVESDKQKGKSIRIRNAQNRAMWALSQMFPDGFGLHGSQRDRPKRCWWLSMQSKWGGIREWRESRTECLNVSPASLCILTESFS